MKRYLVLFSALALLAGSCTRTGGPGTLDIVIGGDYSVADIVKSRVDSYTELPSAGDFTLTITNQAQSVVWTGTASSWDSTLPLAAGVYKVSAVYGEEGIEGKDKPWFLGEKDVEIESEKTSSAEIRVSLGNCIVRCECTTAFLNYFPEYSFSLATGAGNVLGFSNTQTDAVFMDAYKFTLSGTLKAQGGNSVNVGPKEYEGLEAATCYTLKFDATKTGGVKLQISFNDSTEEVDLGNLELN